MKIAIYTLTRDRLEYTKYCFATLREKAGYPFDHFIVDNGSQDGTVEWLKENEKDFAKVIYNPENRGISVGSNQALKEIQGYDLIIKMDNDCLVQTDGILDKIVKIYQSRGIFSPQYVLSPYVNGINNQPTRGLLSGLGGYTIGQTSIIGGLFHIVPNEVYSKYTYDETLPLAKYQDDFFCKWVKENGGVVGYIEELKVEHYEGTDNQAKRFPEYFQRKWKEEV
jgi:glycosyltransferase involved in cell wall biosynthesis